MNVNSPPPTSSQREKHILLEVASIEKQLWTLVHSRGLLQSDVRNLYRKACLSYENFILSDHEQAELQDVEYSLWKLHYRHIDEFRKKIKKKSANSEGITSATSPNGANALKIGDSHLEGFKSFLLEATEFYKNLIVKIKRSYGLSEEISSHTRSDISISVEPKKMQKCLFLCHRFFVCLGDLARYRELYEAMDFQNHNWSVAVNHYSEATMSWPDGGNPQNQLAVLATYVGDEFLALYHCVRSLAVKEPFPDAWNNLILLFERNRSSHLHSLCTETCFDFSKPSERSSLEIKTERNGDFSDCNMSNAGEDCSLQTNLWSLIIRTMSFFFIKSSGFDQFHWTFASTMRVLDAGMELNDTKLKAMLESYQLMDSARTGPFRALQVVSIFIFIFHNLTNSSETKRSEDKEDMQQAELTQLALLTTFIFMGRFADRCLKANPLDSCPLLPAILVFVEWLVSVLDKVERYTSDGKVASAISYFFRAFVNLLKQLNVKGEILSTGGTLWEDYELRGFAPLALAHSSLDFSSHSRHSNSFDNGIKDRVHRILGAAMRIADRSSGSQKLIVFDKSRMNFYTAEQSVISGRKEPGFLESSSDSDLKVKAKKPNKCNSKAREGCEDQILGEKASGLYSNGKSVVTEDEEVILFEPLTRHNSAPPYNSVKTKDPGPPKDGEDQPLPSDECLRHTTSLLIEQKQAHGHQSTFDSDVSNFRRSIPFKQQETSSRDMLSHSFSEGPLSAGPPSLNAWVLNKESLKNDCEKGRDVRKHDLSPIQELASASLSGLSLGEIEDTVIRSRDKFSNNHFSPPVYSVPVPSAPLMPDDAAWYNGMQSSVPDLKTSGGINRTANFYYASQTSAYPDWTAARSVLHNDSPLPGFMDGYPPFSGLTSSEWLRQYRENHNIIGANKYTWPSHYVASGPRNFPACDSSGVGLLDKYGTPTDPTTNMESLPFYAGVLPTAHRLDDSRREKLFNGYQRPNVYGCGAMPDLREDPKPLIQYLKEKEWLLQREQALRGGTYTGN